MRPTSNNVPNRIDISIRLRRAIVLNDLLLVKRILKHNPAYLQNPDFTDKSNTSLHLAAKYGFVELADYLINTGHETSQISQNVDWDTPLTLAISAQHIPLVTLLISHFPRCVNWHTKSGTLPLHLAARSGSVEIISLLLHYGADINGVDNDGNTPVHYASAYGHLGAIKRLLEEAGMAAAMRENKWYWTPIAYSCSVSAEVFFKNLVAEYEKKKQQQQQQQKKNVEVQKQQQRDEIRVKKRGGLGGGGGLRLVVDEDEIESGQAEMWGAAVVSASAPGQVVDLSSP
ncbi:MAG: hypothetical protein M1834_008598, partial [Cirrosporium novae-zelandiae]